MERQLEFDFALEERIEALREHFIFALQDPKKKSEILHSMPIFENLGYAYRSKNYDDVYALLDYGYVVLGIIDYSVNKMNTD